MNKSIYGNVIPTNIPNSGSLAGLSDVQLSSPTNGQVLEYNGSKWVNTTNSTAPVQSVFTRTGNVIAQSGDYNIAQIINSSILASTANVNITSPTDGQILKYDGGTSRWINSSQSFENIYYKQVYIYSTSVNPAIANTHYTLNFGGTITIAPLNPGEHLMITADVNTITINFTGTSFITNSILGGGTSNPSFSMFSTTIELMCVYNSSQTYYNIIRVSQNRPGAFCTLNGNKISALSQLNDIPDVVLTSPSNGQALIYNGTNWINNNIVTSVAMTVPSEFSITGSPITSSGTLAITKNNQTQNLIYASPNSSTGIPTFRTLVAADISAYQNTYYNLISTTSSITAVANTHYELTSSLTITINPLNVGEHLKFTAGANAITIIFTGASFILNWNGSGGTSNPTIIILNNTIELVCTYNTGQTYYYITSSKQSRINAIGSTFTINGQKQSALANIGDIPDVVLTSPSNGQILGFDGTNWINTAAGTVSSVAMSVPSDLAVSGSPITSSGTLAITRNSQAANLFLASPNSSSGIPVYRLIDTSDITTYQNIYYNLISTSSTTINPAIANTHYELTSGGTITINPFNAGQHLKITSGSNAITINFTGASFILNWNGSGGTSNPSISILNTTIELTCTFNVSQTYYYITSSKQSRINSIGSTFTINSQKQAAIANIGDIPDVILTSPSNGQALTYNGTNWVNTNSSSSSSFLTFNARGNIGNAQYMCQNGVISGDVRLANILIPRTCTITSLTGAVNISSPSGAGWQYEVWKNGSGTGLLVQMLGTTLTNKVTGSISFAQYDTLTIYITEIGGATVPSGWCTVEYQ